VVPALAGPIRRIRHHTLPVLAIADILAGPHPSRGPSVQLARPAK
jgi:hypothetical protein